MRAVIRGKERYAVNVGDVRQKRPGEARVDVLNQVSTGLGAISGPKFDAVARLPCEEDSTVSGYEPGGAYPVDAVSRRGCMSIRPIRSAYRRVSPMAHRAGS